jgi:hypothetical protein
MNDRFFGANLSRLAEEEWRNFIELEGLQSTKPF